MKYFASCSFGKDSVATVLLALEHNEPLDEILFTEVMFDHARNISGEIPEHIDWIHSTAIPRFEAMGVKTRILRSDRDYMYFFQNTVGGEARRQNLWFSAGWQMHHKSGLQNKANKTISAEFGRRCYRVYRYRRRRTETVTTIERPQNITAGKIRIYRGDGKGTMRKTQPAIPYLPDGYTGRLLVLSQCQNIQPIPSTETAPGFVAGTGNTKPHTQYVQYRI